MSLSRFNESLLQENMLCYHYKYLISPNVFIYDLFISHISQYISINENILLESYIFTSVLYYTKKFPYK